jgi:hypothetical protein
VTVPYLIAMRLAIIMWSSMMVMPWEHVIDRIDDELAKKGIVL